MKAKPAQETIDFVVTILFTRNGPRGIEFLVMHTPLTPTRYFLFRKKLAEKETPESFCLEITRSVGIENCLQGFYQFLDEEALELQQVFVVNISRADEQVVQKVIISSIWIDITHATKHNERYFSYDFAVLEEFQVWKAEMSNARKTLPTHLH